MAYFVTIDGGTESLRARVYDVTGNCLSSVAEPYETTFAAGARAEQNPADWWTNFVKATRAAIADAKVDANDIQSTLRPALIWMDVRANEEAEAVLATGDSALKINGNGQGPISALIRPIEFVSIRII